jgi:copper(I)-binding protein
MKRFTLLLAAVAMLAAANAGAHEYKLGALEIGHPWARATPKGATIGGGYLKITNNGATPDRLVSGSSSISARFEIHEMSVENGVMRMRPLKDGVEIKPGQTVEFKPGGLHIMMVDLKQPIKAGDHIKGTLVFQKAGSVDVDFIAVPVGSSPGGSGGASGGMGNMPGMSGHQH